MIDVITQFLEVTERPNNNRLRHRKKYNEEGNRIKKKSKDDDELYIKRKKFL